MTFDEGQNQTPTTVNGTVPAALKGYTADDSCNSGQGKIALHAFSGEPVRCVR